MAIKYLVRQIGSGRAWDTQITGYGYSLETTDGAEIFAYHWHAAGVSHVTRPHLHVRSAVSELASRRTHFPTGYVPLADVVRLLIEEWQVPPLRSDWAGILEVSRLDFAE